MTITNLEQRAYTLEALRKKKGFICDMDGVIYHGNLLLPGVREFVDFLKREKKKFLFLTNSSERAPKELQQKLERLGLEVDEKHFYTSALSTAAFLSQQCPGGSVYVIGEPGLVTVREDAPGTQKQAHSHEGQEFDYVLEGTLKIVLGGNELYLQPGDSIYYDSSLPHVMYAVEGDCRFIAVVIKEGAKA